MRNYSRQREALLNEIRMRRDHPTAEELYNSLREKMPRYSLGTVYRNLAELSEKGYIKKIPCTNGPERYDGCVSPHVHFSCGKCGKVYDVQGVYEQYINMPAIQDAALRQMCDTHTEDAGRPYRIDGLNVTLYGICSECGAGTSADTQCAGQSAKAYAEVSDGAYDKASDKTSVGDSCKI